MTPKRSSCIFDSLPTLDSWYDKEPIPTPSRSCATSRKSMPKRTKCGQNVSFSCDPPSVCYLEGDCDYTDKESHDEKSGNDILEDSQDVRPLPSDHDWI